MNAPAASGRLAPEAPSGDPGAPAMEGAAAAAPPPPPLLDPSVSRAKFEREVAQFRSMEAEYLKRGWILLKVEYPTVTVLMAAAHMTPPAVVLGVVVDFTNYDFWPLGVQFVHPFTLAPIPASAFPLQLGRRISLEGGNVQYQPLIQTQADDIPFLCLKGVRQYHQHPAHTNDPWLAYRGSGIGTLYHILNVIHQHGIAPLFLGMQINVMLQSDAARFPE